MHQPLADRIRPSNLDDVAGQKHILGKNGLLRRVIEGGKIPNMIFYGPSGTGKTTVAEIAAARIGRPLYRINATTASLSDIRNVIKDVGTLLAPDGVVLYLDEIQYFNKKQQQSLLEFMENGSLTLIASTTENPYFYVYNAVLSRSTVFEFQPLEANDILPILQRGLEVLSKEQGRTFNCDEEVAKWLAVSCGGDVRRCLNALETIAASYADMSGDVHMTIQDAQTVSRRSAMRYDRDGDEHYDILSAFQKSIRGSDPDAAVHYLARLLEAGDLISPCRRLMVIASEDIGLAYPQAVPIVKACVDSANMLGLPEARIPLAEAAIFLATCPKSNSAIVAIDAAMADLRAGINGSIPQDLKDSHYKGAAKLGRGEGYRYPHSYPNHYVPQQYLPEILKDRRYYAFGENKTEQAARRYWDIVKNGKP